MKKVILLVVLLSQIGVAQTRSIRNSPPLGESAPESVGISAERLARMDGVLQQAVTDGKVPGVAAIVIRNGKIVYHKAFGMADNEANRSLKRDDIFRIASMSKAITSTAVMMLWEEGKFQLDDPISKYIPEFKNPTVIKNFKFADSTYTTEPAKSEITIRHLLTHTSGIGYGVIDGEERFKALYHKAGIIDLYTTKDVKIADNIKKLAKLPLHHHPGEKFTYSEGLDVLGYFIEIMSGMTFDEFLRKRLFEPLGMTDTYFYLPNEKANRLVAVQQPKNGQWTRFPVTFYDTDYPIKGAKSFYSGGAGLSSTAKDYATFLLMYLNGGELGGKRFLSRKTVETIMANHAGDLFGGGDKGNSHHGLAFEVYNQPAADRGGNGSKDTFTWGGYFNTNYFADPKEKVIGVLMKQTQNSNDNLNTLFRQMIYQSIDD